MKTREPQGHQRCACELLVYSQKIHSHITMTQCYMLSRCTQFQMVECRCLNAQLPVDDDDDYYSAGNDVHVLFCSSIRITTCTSHRPRYSMYPNCLSDDLVNIRENHISWIADNLLPLCFLTHIIRLYIVSPQPLHDSLLSGSVYTNCFTYITFKSLKTHIINNRTSMQSQIIEIYVFM